MSTFTLCNMKAEPGQRVHGYLALKPGEIELPATIIRGKEPGKTVLITAGVHAGEYVGVEAAVQLGYKLKVEKVRGTIIIVKVVNRPAFEQRKGSMGLTDQKNLNREFPGNPSGTEMERLAYGIGTELHSVADYYIDLHCGDDYEQLTPYVYYAGKASEEVVKMSRRMAEQVDVPYMVRSMVSSGGSYNYAASCGIPSILIERGGMGGWTREEAQSMRRDVRNVLCFLGVYTGKQDYRSYYPLDLVDLRYQDASQSGLWYPTKKAGDMFRKQELLGEVRDYEGKVLEQAIADYDGVVLYQTGSLQVLENGPMIAYGRIHHGEDDRKERIVHYWGKRSESFCDQRRSELHNPIADRWMTEIKKMVPALSREESKEKLKILDVGCGTGFFTILLARLGHEVTGIDLTPEMIMYAKLLAQEENVDCRFTVMDAEHLDFPDENFDLVISRNLTWVLPDVSQAYKEWTRVLKKGGMLLNFDANYGADDFSDVSALPHHHAHHMLGTEMMRECEEIKNQLPISSKNRPAWDLDVLGRMKLEEFSIDLGVSSRLYRERDEFYNPTPLFALCVRK